MVPDRFNGTNRVGRSRVHLRPIWGDADPAQRSPNLWDRINFHSSALYANNIFLILEDLGPALQYTGLRRFAGSHGTINPSRDNQPLVEGLVTSWQAEWMQTYSGFAGTAAQYPRPGLSSAIQGRNLTDGLYYATMLGGFTTTPGSGDDEGQTMQAALEGAELQAARIITTGVPQPLVNRGITRMDWHAHDQASQVLHMVDPPPNHIFSAYDNAGQQ